LWPKAQQTIRLVRGNVIQTVESFSKAVAGSRSLCYTAVAFRNIERCRGAKVAAERVIMKSLPVQDAEKKVDPVQMTTNGYGFVVRAKDSQGLRWLIEYETREDAEQARAEMVRVIQKAIAYQAYP
jgi:hypothetical protein